MAPTGSSICATFSKNSTENTTTTPLIIPMMAAPVGETASHPAVMATKPARAPLSVMETSGFLYLSQVKTMVAVAAKAAARFVVTMMVAVDTMASSAVSEREDPPLKPNQQNQRMNTPSAPRVKLCPGIALAPPFSSYLSILAPRIFAPQKAATPPTICTAVEPAKSWNPNVESHPPPQIQ